MQHSRSGDFHAAGLGAVESCYRKIRGRASLFGSRGGLEKFILHVSPSATARPGATSSTAP